MGSTHWDEVESLETKNKNIRMEMFKNMHTTYIGFHFGCGGISCYAEEEKEAINQTCRKRQQTLLV